MKNPEWERCGHRYLQHNRSPIISSRDEPQNIEQGMSKGEVSDPSTFRCSIFSNSWAILIFLLAYWEVNSKKASMLAGTFFGSREVFLPQRKKRRHRGVVGRTSLLFSVLCGVLYSSRQGRADPQAINAGPARPAKGVFENGLNTQPAALGKLRRIQEEPIGGRPVCAQEPVVGIIYTRVEQDPAKQGAIKFCAYLYAIGHRVSRIIALAGKECFTRRWGGNYQLG